MPSKTLLTLIILLTPALVSAAFVPLVGIPGIDANASFNDYINALYALSISIAALIAVIKIIIAGVKWMLSDVVSSKQEAKSDIQGALIGLLIILAAVLILEVINPQLKSSSLFLSPVGTVKRAAAPDSGAAPKLKDWELHKDNCPKINTNTQACQDLKAHCARDHGKVVDETNRIMCIIETPTGGGLSPMNSGVGEETRGGGGGTIVGTRTTPPSAGASIEDIKLWITAFEKLNNIPPSKSTPGPWMEYLLGLQERKPLHYHLPKW